MITLRRVKKTSDVAMGTLTGLNIGTYFTMENADWNMICSSFSACVGCPLKKYTINVGCAKLFNDHKDEEVE